MWAPILFLATRDNPYNFMMHSWQKTLINVIFKIQFNGCYFNRHGRNPTESFILKECIQGDNEQLPVCINLEFFHISLPFPLGPSRLPNCILPLLFFLLQPIGGLPVSTCSSELLNSNHAWSFCFVTTVNRYCVC